MEMDLKKILKSYSIGLSLYRLFLLSRRNTFKVKNKFWGLKDYGHTYMYNYAFIEKSKRLSRETVCFVISRLFWTFEEYFLQLVKR